MPRCRNCGSRLTKFDKDICPICGAKNPLEGMTSDTVEITSEFSTESGIKFRVCNKLIMFLFFALLGPFGAGFIYLKKTKTFGFWLICNLLFAGIAFLILRFIVEWSLLISIALPVLAVYLFNIIYGGILCLNPNLKDGEGEYVR